jgi:Zn-dependent peptidase ImmA (M78 family)
MTRVRRQAIEELSNVIRGVIDVSIPINLETIVEKIGGNIRENDLKDKNIAGKVEKNDKTFTITLNKNQSSLRNNFTIAHEIGHLFLHMGYMVDQKKWNSIDDYIDSAKYRLGYSEEEYEANHFAASFLMPEKEYRKFITDNKVDNKIDIKKLSSYFQVSDDAAITRGKWLGIFPWDS